MADPPSHGIVPTPEQATLQITVVICLAPRQLREQVLELPVGSTVKDALNAAGAYGSLAQDGDEPLAVGIWGQRVDIGADLNNADRVELYRPLKVDPKVARRERFARQGARSAGLFARQRPGGKPGY